MSGTRGCTSRHGGGPLRWGLLIVATLVCLAAPAGSAGANVASIVRLPPPPPGGGGVKDQAACDAAIKAWKAQRVVSKLARERTAKAAKKEAAARAAWGEARADLQEAKGDASASELAKLQKILAKAEKLRKVTAKRTDAAAKVSKAEAKLTRKLQSKVDPACAVTHP